MNYCKSKGKNSQVFIQKLNLNLLNLHWKFRFPIMLGFWTFQNYLISCLIIINTRKIEEKTDKNNRQ